MNDYLAVARRHLAELRGVKPAENDNVKAYERNEVNEISPTGPPDDAFSNGLRAGLLLWGGPLGWPSLVEVGLGDGATRWTEWLLLATTDDVRLALTAAQHSGTREHPDPRYRLARWGVERRYPEIAGVVEAGIDAWENFVNEAADAAIAGALEAVEGQAIVGKGGPDHGG